MPSRSFKIAWTKEGYTLAYKKLYVPVLRRRGLRKTVLLALLAALLVEVLAGFVVALAWVFHVVGLPWWGSAVFALLIIALGLFLGSFDVSRQVKQGWANVQKLGEIEYDVSDEALVTRLSNGSYVFLPWEAMKLLGKSEHGLVIERKDSGSPFLLPSSIGADALEDIRMRLTE